MKKNWLILVIVALLGINFYTILGFKRIQRQSFSVLKKVDENEELKALKFNFKVSIENHDLKITNSAFIDSIVWAKGQQQMIVCRLSESHCASCVEVLIKIIRYWAPSIGRDNIIFLGNYRNDVMLKKVLSLYEIEDFRAFGVNKLNIPVEGYGYPYCFVLNRDYSVTNVFVPDKGTPTLSFNYFDLLKKRYF